MNRTRILFVDDEVDVLDAIADLLRADRKRWNVTFASSAVEALERLAREPADIVVSDMRMPKIDGAQLLGEIRTRFPGTIRIVLSGHADRELLIRSVPIAHQFLAKPCDVRTLRTVLARAAQARQMFDEPAIRKAIGALGELPSAPGIYSELLAIAADPRKGGADIARVVERDPGMTAKLLQVVNSSYFGAHRMVASTRQAIAMMGLEMVTSIVLTSEVLCRAERAPIPGFSADAQQRSAIAGATLARELAIGCKNVEEAFAAALLRDVGNVVLALVSAHGRVGTVDSVVHAAVGACLLGTWGLPLAIVEAVAFHHEPIRMVDGDPTLVAIVHVADALCADTAIDTGFLEQAGLANELSRWSAVHERARDERFRQ